MGILRTLASSCRCTNGVNCENVANISVIRMKQFNRTYMGETYEGTGKTTGRIVNKMGTKVICLEHINVNGFQLTNGWKVLGPTIFFPHTMISWKINNVNEINEDSLSLFKILQPKVDVLFLGYGDKKDMSFHKLKEIIDLLRSMKINFEIMTTADAASTFNFCSLDKRYVAAALIPPSQVTFHHGLDRTALTDGGGKNHLKGMS